MKGVIPGLAPVLALAMGFACAPLGREQEGDRSPADEHVSMDEAALEAAPRTSVTVRWRPADHTVATGGAFFRNELTLTNDGTATLGSSGWKLYFSFARRILREGEGSERVVQRLASQGVRLVPGDVARSGDYWVLEPLPSFAPLRSGEHRVISFLAENWAIQKSDAPAGFHLVTDAGARAVRAGVDLDAHDPKQTTRFEGDVLPVKTAALRYEENRELEWETLQPEEAIVPTPMSVSRGAGEYELPRRPLLLHAPPELAREAAYLERALEDALGVAVVAEATGRGGGDVRLAVDPGLDVTGDGKPDAEAYSLSIDRGGITIVGADRAGVFYGGQSLRQIVPRSSKRRGPALRIPALQVPALRIPALRIDDAPLFRHRGMSLDVARHFQPKEEVLKLVDVLSYYKVNKLHLHLTDDEGWRVEIPGLPELTSYGSRRGFDPAERIMLHAGLGSSNDLGPRDHIGGKPRDPRRANGGVEPRHQGFEPATLNFVGRGWGFYSTRDFEDIVAYAAERHVEVIPEIDVPGHARAAVRAMEHRYEAHRWTDRRRAEEYRLVDPDDTSEHTSVQGYRDNFVNPCLESTYAFLAKVVSELRARYEAVGSKLATVHGGGDELPPLGANVWWQGSPRCKASETYGALGDAALRDAFFERWLAIVRAAGAEMMGWDDVIHGGLSLPGFVPMPWSNVWGWGREDDAYRYANEGRSVVLAHATNLYLDLAYEKDPDEPGYYWAGFVDEKKTFLYSPFDVFANATEDRMGQTLAPSLWATKERLTNGGRANVRGMHGLLWGENVKTPELLEYFAFPKMLGVAERAWAREAPTKDTAARAWRRFVNVLGQHALPRLDGYRAVDLRGELPRDTGIHYRVPPPGAVIGGGALSANVRYPGLGIEYSDDGGRSWHPYEGPVSVGGVVLVRSRTESGRTSRATVVPRL